MTLAHLATPKLSFVLFIYTEPDPPVSALYHSLQFSFVSLWYSLFDLSSWLKVKVSSIDVRRGWSGLVEDETSVDSDPFGVICVLTFHTSYLAIFLCAFSQCALFVVFYLLVL